MINLKSIYTVLLALYILTSLLIPLASVNKLIFIALVMIYGGYILYFKKENKFACLKITLAPMIIIGIFAYGYVRAMFGDNDMALARQFLLGVAMFALIYPVEEFDIDIQAMLLVIAKIYIVFYAIYVIDAINLMEYDVPGFVKGFAGLFDNIVTRTIGDQMMALGGGWMKYRSIFGGKGMMIYLGSISFMLVLVCALYIDFFKTKKWAQLLWVALGLMLSFMAGLRACILFIPAALCVITWLQLISKMKLFSAGVIGIAAVVIFVYLLENTSIFSFSNRSNAVKIGHVIYYFEQLNLKQSLNGDGMGSYYLTSFSPTEKRLLAQTEVTFLDHCRYFGIPLSLTVWLSMVFPKYNGFIRDIRKWKIWQAKEELAVLLIYFVWAQLNPVLFNSFGLVVVLWYWNVLFAKNQKGMCKC